MSITPKEKSELHIQRNKAIKNYKDGKYRNVIGISLINDGVECSKAKHNFDVTSKIFSPFFSSLKNFNF